MIPRERWKIFEVPFRGRIILVGQRYDGPAPAVVKRYSDDCYSILRGGMNCTFFPDHPGGTLFPDEALAAAAASAINAAEGRGTT